MPDSEDKPGPQDERPDADELSRKRRAGIGLGIGLGVAMGVVFSNLAIGIALGVALGPALGVLTSRVSKE